MINLQNNFGEYLNEKETLLIKYSIIILSKENKLKHLKFWGKIISLQNEYVILCGKSQDEKIKYYYSVNLNEWAMLPDFQSEDLLAIHKCTELFSGIPSHIFELPTTSTNAENIETHTNFELKEDARIVATIKRIENSFAIYTNGNTISITNVKDKIIDEKLAPNQKCDTIMCKENESINDLKVYINFPKETWKLFMAEEIEISSLIWPGLKIVINPLTKEYEILYIGDGRINIDLDSYTS